TLNLSQKDNSRRLIECRPARRIHDKNSAGMVALSKGHDKIIAQYCAPLSLFRWRIVCCQFGAHDDGAVKFGIGWDDDIVPDDTVCEFCAAFDAHALPEDGVFDLG